MNLEFFNPGEGGESYDPAAFERFKEKIKKNAAFAAAAAKSEQKQKEKEDRLAKILLKFIQTNQKSGILMLAAKLLAENIPASFILSIILLGNEEIKEEIRREVASDLPRLARSPSELPHGTADEPGEAPNEFSVATRFTDESVPLKLKAEIDLWAKGMWEAATPIPFRILETTIGKEGSIKSVLIDCTANVLDDYFAQNNKAEIPYDACFSFCEFFMKGLMERLKKQIENQKELQ